MRKSYVENTYAMFQRWGMSPKYEHPGVYAICVDGQIVYIGKSTNMMMRLA